MKNQIICLLLLPTLLHAQQTALHGVITILNSRFDKGQTEYVPAAEIQEIAAPAGAGVRSGADGRFRLDIAGQPEKEPVFIRVTKAGYQVVNDGSLQILPGNNDTLHLFLATSRYLAASTQRYYDIAYATAEKNLLQLYDRKKDTLAELESQLDADPAQIKSLRHDLSGIQQQFEKIAPLAAYVAGKYAFLNVDNTSPLFQDALRLFLSGDPDSALHLLPTNPVAGMSRKELARMLGFKADLHRIRIEPDSAEQCYRQALRLNEDNPAIRWCLAECLLDQNKPAEARGHYEKCLSLAVAKTDSATQCSRLADVYHTLGQFAEEEQMLCLGLALSKRLAAFDTAQYASYLASACHFLGEFYRAARRAPEAEAMYLRSLGICEGLANKSPELFESALVGECSLLGILCAENNRATESELYFLRSLEILGRLAQTDPIRFERLLAMNASGLGWVYATQQKTAAAEDMYFKALKLFERLAQNNPPQFEPYLAQTAGYLGEMYYQTQQYPESEKMFQRTLEIWKRFTEVDPAQFGPELARTAVNFGHCYFVARKMPKAEKMYRLALETREQLAQDDPARFEPELAETAFHVGAFYDTFEKTTEAEKRYSQALEIYERLAQVDSLRFEPNLAGVMYSLSRLYDNAKKWPEAETMALRALKVWERLARRDPAQFEPALADHLYNMGLFNQHLQKLPEAEKALLQALEIYERLTPRAPMQFGAGAARVETELGLLYVRLDNRPEAEKMLLHAMDTWERLAQPGPASIHPEMARTIMNLSAFRYDDGRLEEAARLGARALTLRTQALLDRQPNTRDDFNHTYAYTAALRDSLTAHRNYPAAITLQQVRAACTDTLWEIDITLLRKAAEDYGNLSWQYLFNRQYAEAQHAAQKALELDDSQHWVMTNLGHAYLLRGDLKKAKKVYREYMDKDGPKAKSMLLKDLDDLEAGGVVHKGISKARKWLQEQ